MATSTSSGPADSRKRIYIIDDHPVFRQGLGQLVNAEPDLVVSGAAGSAEDALKALETAEPDLVLVDISLPGKSGLDLIKELRQNSSKLKLLVVSMHDEAVYADRVLRAGGDGYIMKQEDPAEIIAAIRDVLAGRIYVSEEVLSSGGKRPKTGDQQTDRDALEELTDTELQVLELLGGGRSDAEIASQLHLTPKQVETASHSLQKKLKLDGEHALTRYAVCWVESASD